MQAHLEQVCGAHSGCKCFRFLRVRLSGIFSLSASMLQPLSVNGTTAVMRLEYASAASASSISLLFFTLGVSRICFRVRQSCTSLRVVSVLLAVSCPAIQAARARPECSCHVIALAVNLQQPQGHTK